MPTLLTNKKMSPELARRIEARVTGKRRRPGRGIPPLMIAGLRFAAIAIVVTLIAMFALGRREYRRAVASEQQRLLAIIDQHASELGPDDWKTAEHVERWMARAAGGYEGDRIASELRTPGALAKLLQRPLLYVRGDLLDFTNPTAARAAALDSKKDPLLLCLIDPPKDGSERAQMKKVFAAYAGGQRVEKPTPNARRVADLHLGLSPLTQAWRDEIEAADAEDELARLRQSLERAPIDEAKRAAKARLLLMALDEPATGKQPAELDGERAHQVRVQLVDLGRDQVLLRLRREVDPAWISKARRPDYARGLDGCKLALDVHEAVQPATASAETP